VTTQNIKEVVLSNYRIFETETFIDTLNKIQKDKREKIYEKILNYVYPQLEITPFYGQNIKKLANYDPDTWRYRIGKYRLFYEVDKKENIISLTAIEFRSKAY